MPILPVLSAVFVASKFNLRHYPTEVKPAMAKSAMNQAQYADRNDYA